MLVATRPLTVAGRELEAGDPLPDGLRARTVTVLERSGRVQEVEGGGIDIDALVDGAEHLGFGRWLLPNGMRVQSKKAELRDTTLQAIQER